MTQPALSISSRPSPDAAWSPRQAAVALMLRTVLFIGAQGLLAVLLTLFGEQQSWARSAHWWQLTAVVGNVATIVLLVRCFGVPAAEWLSMLIPRGLPQGGVKSLIGVLVAAIPLAAVPNYALASVFLGSPQEALQALLHPLPVTAAVVAVIAFPLSTAAVELPLYYGIIQPRLKTMTRSRWLVIALPAMTHSLQHIGLPLLLDAGFLAWRGLMFLPFALLLSWALSRRPALMPYLVLVHFLLDLQMSILLLAISL